MEFARKRDMSTEVIFKSPNSKGKDIVVVKPFKLEAAPRCYVCGAELKAEEKKHKSVFKYYNSDGDELGTVENYVCFDCVEKLTGRRPDHE